MKGLARLSTLVAASVVAVVPGAAQAQQPEGCSAPATEGDDKIVCTKGLPEDLDLMGGGDEIIIDQSGQTKPKGRPETSRRQYDRPDPGIRGSAHSDRRIQHGRRIDHCVER
jgi:hypothetical protein